MRLTRPPATILFLLGVLAGCTEDPVSPTDRVDPVPSEALVAGGMELQPLPGATDVSVSAVNNSGQVVGTSGGRVVLWENAVPIEITGLVAVGGINDAGQVVGTVQVGANRHAAIWDAGTITDIGTLPGETESAGVAITNNGWVAATSSGGRSFVWKGGVITELQPFGDDAIVTGVNASGQAVGRSHDSQLGADPLVVWEDGVPEDTGLDLITNSPVGISDEGVAAFTNDCGCSVITWQNGSRQSLIAPSGERGGGAGSFWTATITAGGTILGGMDGDVYVWENDEFTILDGTGSLDNCLAASDSGYLVCVDDGYTYPFLTTVANHATPAGTVTDLTVTSTTNGTATLTWTQVDDGTGSPALYSLKYSGGPYLYYPNGTVGCEPQGTSIGAPISCTVVGLDPDTDYEFILASFGYDANGVKQWPRYSNLTTGSTSSAPVTVVLDLMVTASTGTSLTVAWTEVDDGTGSPALYRLKYALPQIHWPSATVGCDRTIDGTAIGAAMSCTVGGLQPDTDYELQLRSFHYDANNLWTGVQVSNVTTGRTGPTPAVSVQDLRITDSTAHTLTVEWTQVDDGTGSPAWYRVKYAEPSLQWSSATVGCDRTLVGTQIGATMSCTIEGLSVETGYEIQLASFGTVGGVWVGAQRSNVTSGSTVDASVVRPVSDLTVAVGITEMTLSWTQVSDGQGGPASYQLRYAQPPFDWASADVACDVSGTQIGDQATCTVTGLRAHYNEYEFQLVSFRDANGAWADPLYSNSVSARTPRVRLSVNDLEVLNTTESTVTLRWEQVSDALGYPAQYQVRYGSPFVSWGTATTGCDVVGDGVYVDVSCTVTGLSPTTTYDFQLRSYRLENGVWVGARYSNVTSGSTAPAGG